MPHNLIYGKIGKEDLFNWTKKAEVGSKRVKQLFRNYPGGLGIFLDDFVRFFDDPRRFSYTPLVLCKGMKPLSS
jgi:hypothetical protein